MSQYAGFSRVKLIFWNLTCVKDLTNSKSEWYSVTLDAINIVSTHKVQTTHDASSDINIFS